MAERQYIGARYVPLPMGEWDANIKYEALSIVIYNDDSYTSKKPVPAGIVPTNKEYWALTSIYSVKYEALDRKIDATKADLQEEINTLKESSETEINNVIAELNTTRQSVNTNTQNIVSLQTGLGNVNTNISELQGKVSTNTSNISTLEGDLSGILNDVTDINGNIDIIKQDLKNLDNQVNGYNIPDIIARQQKRTLIIHDHTLTDVPIIAQVLENLNTANHKAIALQAEYLFHNKGAIAAIHATDKLTGDFDPKLITDIFLVIGIADVGTSYSITDTVNMINEIRNRFPFSEVSIIITVGHMTTISSFATTLKNVTECATSATCRLFDGFHPFMDSSVIRNYTIVETSTIITTLTDIMRNKKVPFAGRNMNYGPASNVTYTSRSLLQMANENSLDINIRLQGIISGKSVQVGTPIEILTAYDTIAGAQRNFLGMYFINVPCYYRTSNSGTWYYTSGNLTSSGDNITLELMTQPGKTPSTAYLEFFVPRKAISINWLNLAQW